MEEQVYEAEIVDEAAVSDNGATRSLNTALGATVAVVLVFLMMSRAIGAPLQDQAIEESLDGYTSIADRHLQNYYTDDQNSYVLKNGSLSGPDGASLWLGTHHFVEFELPLEEGGAAPNGKVSLAVWVPIMEDGMTVPVIAEFGPYFDEASVETGGIEEPGTWLGTMIIEQIVPHGFAFAQVSVMGTGRSNHCMDLMGTAEQLGVDAAVTWLGSQNWSNGNVGMIGKSYDGSTPWQAAMFGNEHLTTIVPISGLIGVMELMWRNGSSEARAPIMHNGVYGSYGIDGDLEDSGNMCPDYIAGPATGGAAWAWGGEAAGTYWAERYFLDRVLENYNGSVYLIQGMHDWNVDPHMAVPTINLLYDNNIDAKGLFGQWDHDYPDRPQIMFDRSGVGRGIEAFPEMVRMDWMQDLLEWFTYYLKEEGPKPWLGVEIQSNQGPWRFEDRYPMSNTTELLLELGSSDLAAVGGGNTIFPDASSGPVYETPPLDEPLYFGGLPRLHVNVNTASVGGQIYALLEDCDGADCIHIGHAIMDLRYHAGGADEQTWTPVFEEITALMEFFPMDVEVAAGHTIKLTLRSTGEDYLPSAASTAVTVVNTGSTLQLDTFDPATREYYDTVQCTSQICQDNA
ncbi:MAG TPA: CocE/NonD family hydrolase [Candidatus Poseidoniaceae archaeon]|nr:MAG TPA: CocE/NonD family hydrolase [Candidatus Poseidoniales archaeon]HII45198.1 CocE/NonD family hydrolase [Candidatus Poseidoniaceae archaeon]|tara:strand:+ start:281 stop:2158 length:1878 start_codon:yes stop_codon:yes gene_type:complete